MDRRDGQQYQPELALGQRFVARVEAVLPDLRFRVLVNGRRMLLRLPGSTPLGETLELAVLDKTARGVIAGPVAYAPLSAALRRFQRRCWRGVGHLSRVVGTCRREVHKWILKA